MTPAMPATIRSFQAGIRLSLFISLLLLGSCSFAPSQHHAAPQPPAELFQELFARVQLERIFADGKTFADAVPKQAPSSIMTKYRQQQPTARAQLETFVATHFVTAAEGAPPSTESEDFKRVGAQAHIGELWDVLTRPPLAPPAHASQLPLNHPYVVPGGRFRELYYWDSYFTMLGLLEDRRDALVIDMVDNFAELIDRYGHVPNGTRSYYLSRSQPPFFFLMVGLTARDETAAYARYLPQLRREYQFWMRGAAGLRSGEASQHVVALAGGALLNRYWDTRDTPRDESYREDIEVATAAQRPHGEVYRELRSAAESGWDFSSRWLEDGRTLASIQTTSMIPVDLNSLLYGLEGAIAAGCRQVRDAACVETFERHATQRREAMNRYLWNAATERFLDYNWRERRQWDRLSAATLYPLFLRIATVEQARGVAKTVAAELLASGGLSSTTAHTGQQWDAPNGWAPLQWIAVLGLDAYGETKLASDIATRWLRTVQRTYCETGKLLEKYDVETIRPGGGGEYPLQDGFGWTNGVTRALLARYPHATDVQGSAGLACPVS